MSVVRSGGLVALAGLLCSSASCSFSLDFDGYSVRGEPDAGGSGPISVLLSQRAAFHSYRFGRGAASFSVPAAEGLLAGAAPEPLVLAGSLTSSAGGAVELAADGSFQYTPPGAAGAFWGDDYFEFSLVGSATFPARVRLTLPPAVFELAELAGNPHGGFGVSGAAAQDLAGYARLGAAGDVNGDGLEDFLIGALGPSQNQAFGVDLGVGRSVHVLFGKHDTAPVDLAELSRGSSAAGFVVLSDGKDLTFDSFGAVAAAAGDVNGDGLDDIIIGSNSYNPAYEDPGYAPGANGPLDANGAAYVVFGKRDTAPVQSSDLRAGRGGGFAIFAAAPLTFAGNSVQAAGDVNGDGLDDVILGVPMIGPQLLGAAYVVLGKIGPEPVQLSDLAAGGPAGFPLNGTPEDWAFGVSVAGVGDLNGDGLADVAALGPTYPSTDQKQGRGVVVLGRRETTPVSLVEVAGDPTLGFLFNATEPKDYLGAVNAAGDLNGDGLDDFLVGTPFASLGPPVPAADAGVPDAGPPPAATGNPFPEMGVVYELLGSRSLGTVELRSVEDGSAPGFVIGGNQTIEHLGVDVGSGDLNADGLSDVIVTTPATTTINESYLIFGTRSPRSHSLGPGAVNADGVLVLRATGSEAAGGQVRSGADFNGDGIDDLLIAAPQYAAAPQSGGGAYVVFGWDMTGALAGRDAALIGGSGDDIFELPVTPVAIVRGGHGLDTLRAAGGPDTIDLTLPGRYESIEVVDVRGGGPQRVLLDDAALRRIPGNQSGFAFNLARRLSVLGDREDTLVFDLTGYTVRGSVAGRSVYGRPGYYYGLEVAQELQLESP